MYAVIKTGGKQYRVAPGEEVRIERLPGEVGETVTFDKVLMTSDGETVSVGKPYVEEAKVVGRVLQQGRGRKIVVFKYKKRKNYRRKTGHRQDFSLVKIEGVEV